MPKVVAPKAQTAAGKRIAEQLAKQKAEDDKLQALQDEAEREIRTLSLKKNRGVLRVPTSRTFLERGASVSDSNLGTCFQSPIWTIDRSNDEARVP